MKNCKYFERIIERFYQGAASQSQIDELLSHTENCDQCALKFREIKTLQQELPYVLKGRKSPDAAAAEIVNALDKSCEGPNRFGQIFSTRFYIRAAAACVVFALIVFGIMNFSSEMEIAETDDFSIERIQGLVLLSDCSGNSWRPIDSEKVHLRSGDRFLVAKSAELVLRMSDGSTIELFENTQLYTVYNNKCTEISLVSGTMAADLTEGHKPFYVVTAQGRVTALGTEFSVTVN